VLVQVQGQVVPTGCTEEWLVSAQGPTSSASGSRCCVLQQPACRISATNGSWMVCCGNGGRLQASSRLVSAVSLSEGRCTVTRAHMHTCDRPACGRTAAAASRALNSRVSRGMCWCFSVSALAVLAIGGHLLFLNRAPSKAVLYVNDGNSPCDKPAWHQPLTTCSQPCAACCRLLLHQQGSQQSGVAREQRRQPLQWVILPATCRLLTALNCLLPLTVRSQGSQQSGVVCE
jgi:hypothetical protein